MSDETRAVVGAETSGHLKVRDQMVKLGAHTTTEELRTTYQNIASDYDHQGDIVVSPRSVATAFVKDYESHVIPCEVHSTGAQLETSAKPAVLDICCGTGLVGVFLRENGFDGDVDGLDLSKEMLQVAHKKGLYRNLFREVVGGHGSLTVATDSYDAVLCSAAYCQGHLRGDSLREFARIVRPGGLIVVNVRDDIRNMEDYGRPLTVAEQLSNEGVWEIVRKEENVEYSYFNKCIMLTCRKR